MLHILFSYFDHNTGLVARPVLVMDKSPVNDPHDNASMSIDGEGHIWIFVSGRGTKRLGRIYRSKLPHTVTTSTSPTRPATNSRACPTT